MVNLIKRIKNENIQYTSMDQMLLMDSHLNKAGRRIEDLIFNLVSDPVDFMHFAYELRRIDTHNTYSYELLNGQVQPSILVDIICSNQFIPET